MLEKNKSEILIYQTEDGQTKVEVAFDGDTVWLTQKKMAELFGVKIPAINKQLKNVFEDGELDEKVVISNLETTTLHGAIKGKTQTNTTQFYNLDAILAVGYRMKSSRAIQFRKWASSILKEYMQKGFAMNDELLKNAGGGTYFKELLERIRDIRSSEKIFYRQVLDLFATSIDYDPKSGIAQEFFKEMQNKMHFAVHGNTAPELIIARADADKPFMGLQAFKGHRPIKAEVMVAKNYLSEEEVKTLNLMVSAYLESAQLKAQNRIPMYMKDWVKEMERFLTYQERPVLKGSGNITRADADKKALEEYGKYKTKADDELTQVEIDFLDTIQRTYRLLEGKKPKD